MSKSEIWARLKLIKPDRTSTWRTPKNIMKAELNNIFRVRTFAEGIRSFQSNTLNTPSPPPQFVDMVGNFPARLYYINNVGMDSSNMIGLKTLINRRLRHAAGDRTITLNADVIIKFTFFDNGIHSSKVFNSFQLRNFATFWRNLQAYNDLNTANTPDYTHGILGIKITIIREQSGGCSDVKSTKKVGDTRRSVKRSNSNNCFFAEVWAHFTFNNLKLGKVKCNKIRAEFDLEPDTKIPISKALEIFKKYGIADKNIAIMSSTLINTILYPNKDIDIQLNLKNEHYTTIEKTKIKTCSNCEEQYSGGAHVCKVKCPTCCRKFKNLRKHKCVRCMKCSQTYKTLVGHVCDKRNMMYRRAVVEGKRMLLSRDKPETYNTSVDVCHYDIETYQHLHKESGQKIHKTYIVGYTDTDGTYEHFTGDKAISDFIDYLEERGSLMTKPLFLNAFNGANFDHYEIFKELVRRGITPEKQIINNGSIISLEFFNIKCIDVSKHLLGTLDQNLKSTGCEVQKGTLNHNLSKRWEVTDEPRKEEVIKYLKSDVLGLKELYDKVNIQVFTDYAMNLSSYISTSSMTFNQWKKHTKSSGYMIDLPTLKQEEGFRKSVRGGRTYKSKHRFKSEQYESFIKGEIDFNDIIDYMIDADVVSLYPAAMMEEFPVGNCEKLNTIEEQEIEDEENFCRAILNGTLKKKNTQDILSALRRKNKPKKLKMQGKMGIYYIKYITNKNLAHSIGGRREDGALQWDLKDGEGWYTSIDIEDMIENNYQVEIIKGWFWRDTAPVFKEYIKELYKKKGDEAAAGRKGSVAYTLAKLWMNGLYGKNIQRPIYTNTILIETIEEYWKFWGKHTVTDLTPIESERATIWVISGTPRIVVTKEKCITKPTQMGAFILAYSRRIMLNYIKEANPDFCHDGTEESKKRQLKQDFYYTDTDSLQMHKNQANLIKKLGNKELGGITDDLGDDCKIISGKWIAPKLYMLEYVKKGDPKIHYHLRGKGLDKKKLKPEHFIKMDKGGSVTNTKDFQMKKLNFARNSKQVKIPQLSILHYTDEENKSRLTRTVNKNKWIGRRFVEGGSLPHF
tara:strand:+ start:43 stop:3264 length:3222 start_codon:yes stop_codon:yes gene_type:complete